MTTKAVETHVQNLLCIFNHMLSYGCRSSFWELLTQHYAHDSVRFVNEQLSMDEDDVEKGIYWLVLALGETDMLYEVFTDLSKNGSVLAHYDDESFLANHMDRVISVARSVYAGSMSVSGDSLEEYHRWQELRAITQLVNNALIQSLEQHLKDLPVIAEQVEKEEEE